MVVPGEFIAHVHAEGALEMSRLKNCAMIK